MSFLRRLINPARFGTPTPSIRRQLLVWLLIPNFVLWVAAIGSTFYVAKRMTNGAYDENLIDDVRTMASRTHFVAGKLVLDLPPEAIEILKEDNTDSIYYHIVGPDGSLISGDADFPPLDHAALGIRISDGVVKGQSVRIASYGLHLRGHPGLAVVQIAETFLGRELIIARCIRRALIPLLGMLILGSCAVWWAVRKGLGPLEALRMSLQNRSLADLTPLSEEGTPVEIRPLVHAINDLLGRIGHDVQKQRRFIGNAAHQLRTPLAGLKTQVEIMSRRRSEGGHTETSLQQLERGVDRLVRLAKQLLALARAEPDGGLPLVRAVVDLEQIARECAQDFVSKALARGIDFGFVGTDEGAWVHGNRGNLRELCTNLIENALLYTPAGGSVTIRLERRDSSINLIVEDTGVGIPREERKRVFERFYRLNTTPAEGTGLGLSIVKEIADGHQAVVEIADGTQGRGTVFTIRFPRSIELPQVA